MRRQKQFCNQMKIVGKTHHIQQKKNTLLMAVIKLSFFYLGFLSRTFTIHSTAEEGGGYLFNTSLLLPPALQTLMH